MRKTVITWLILLLAACQPLPTPVTRTPAEPLEITVADSLSWLGPDFASCAAEVGVAVKIVDEASASDDVIRLRLGTSETGSYAAKLGEDHLVVIVHPDNPEKDISLETLQAIFSGQQKNWPDQSEIQLWSLPQSSDVTAALLASGIRIENAGLVPTAGAMLNAVAQNGNAIGFIPARWVDEGARVLQVDGLDLSLPILAASRVEPQGTARSWLVCLQQKIGQ
jgi:hypothetical protein